MDNLDLDGHGWACGDKAQATQASEEQLRIGNTPQLIQKTSEAASKVGIGSQTKKREGRPAQNQPYKSLEPVEPLDA